jgi:hypothetical protein
MCSMKMCNRNVLVVDAHSQRTARLQGRCVSVPCMFKIYQEHNIDYRFVVGGFLQGKLAS